MIDSIVNTNTDTSIIINGMNDHFSVTRCYHNHHYYVSTSHSIFHVAMIIAFEMNVEIETFDLICFFSLSLSLSLNLRINFENGKKIFNKRIVCKLQIIIYIESMNRILKFKF